jgi:hypothetical protein
MRAHAASAAVAVSATATVRTPRPLSSMTLRDDEEPMRSSPGPPTGWRTT